jgi:hypothetical protein
VIVERDANAIVVVFFETTNDVFVVVVDEKLVELAVDGVNVQKIV